LETPAEALERVCSNFWPAIYHSVRTKGFSHEESQDLAQEFVADFIHEDFLHPPDAVNAPLRARIFRGLRDFLHRRRREANCVRRGGRRTIIPLDDTSPEDQPVTQAPPDETYDREWASTLMLRATALLRQDYESCGRGPLFDLIRPALTGKDLLLPCTAIARAAGLPVAKVNDEVRLASRRLGDVLRHEVAATVISTADVDDELRYVLSVLAHGQ
jgi:RNA polymerase sigma-70 factor (ECF subfamily)